MVKSTGHCCRLTVGFVYCRREWPRPAKFFPSNKQAAVIEKNMTCPLFMPGVQEAAFSALQDGLLGLISKALFELGKSRWLAFGSSSTVTFMQSEADESLEPQDYLAKKCVLQQKHVLWGGLLREGFLDGRYVMLLGQEGKIGDMVREVESEQKWA